MKNHFNHIIKSRYFAIFLVLFFVAGPSTTFAQIMNKESKWYGKKWSVTLQGGATVSGPGDDFEQAMIDSGFDNRSPANFFGSGRDHPFSDDSGFGWFSEVKYYIQHPIAVSFKYASLILEGTNGYHLEAGFLFIENSSKSLSSIVSANLHDFLKFGIGPTLYFLETKDTSSFAIEGSNASQNTKLGIVLDLAFRIPRKSTFYVELDFQFYKVGNADVGPFAKEAFDGSLTTFPRTEANFDHTSIGLGIGVRI